MKGLDRADFQVRLDGSRVEIEGFHVLRRTESVRVAAGDERVSSERRVEPPSQARRVLVLFDLVFSGRRHLLRSVEGVRRMIDDQIGVRDEVAVAYLSGTGARILVGFTRDRREIDLGLDLIEGIVAGQRGEIRRAAARLQEHVEAKRGDSELAFLSRRFGAVAALALGSDLQDSGTAVGGAALAGSRPAESGSTIDPVVGSVVPGSPQAIGASLEETVYGSTIRFLAMEIGRLATLLRDLPGPKELLYLSEGFASSVLESFGSQERPRVLGYLEEMHESLLRGGWTLHGIDVRGIPGPWDRGFDAHSLFYMANETGGQVLENYNRIGEATERLLHRTSVTYLLTVRAEGIPADGRRHEIEVRVSEAGWRTRVHHRPAYYAPRPAEALDGLERELRLVDRLLGDDEENHLAARARAGVTTREAESVPVRFGLSIPAEELNEEVEAGVLPLEVRVFALDARGGAVSAWSRRLTLDLAEVGDRLQAGGLHLTGTLVGSSDVDRLRLLVRIPNRSDFALITLPVEESWSSGSWTSGEGLVLEAG